MNGELVIAQAKMHILDTTVEYKLPLWIDYERIGEDPRVVHPDALMTN